MSQIDSRCLELINADIDGALSDGEADELRRCLTDDAEARALHGRLKTVVDTLASIEEVEPPEDLRESIMASIVPPDSESHRRFTWWPLASVFRYAAVFFAGAVIATGAFTLTEFPIDTFNETDLVGSMTRQNRFHAPGRAADSLRIPAGTVTGHARLYPVADGALIEFQLDSEQPVRVEVDYEPPGGFGGFLQLDNQIAAITASAGRLSLTSQGSQHFVIALGRKEGSSDVVAIRFYTEGELVNEGTLKIP